MLALSPFFAGRDMEIVDNKAILLKLKKPSKITNVIPHSKVVDDHRVLVRWGMDETRILRNMGIKAPSPIIGKYNWPGKHKPYSHQKETASFLTMNRRSYCFNDMGSGKTASCIWAADYLMRIGEVRKVLIVCPVSIMDQAWGRDIFNFAMHRTYGIAHGTAAQRRRVIATDPDFLIVNFDGVEVLQKEIMAGDYDLVIIDECFVAGTLVSTPIGRVPIENLNAGDKVLTSNGEMRIKKLVRNITNKLVEVRLNNGEVIKCTPEHPFFTDIGWVCAKYLEGRRLISDSDLSCMRKRVRTRKISNNSSNKEQHEFGYELLEILRSEEVAFGESGKKPLQQHVTRREREAERSEIGRTSSKAVSSSESKRNQAESSGREWDRHDSLRRDGCTLFTEKLGLELPSSVGQEAARLSYELQARFCEPYIKNRSGGGRWEPHTVEQTEARSKERGEVEGIRVVSVSYIECPSGESVYNLEVEGTPNYFVGNNWLVHNCNAYKTATTNRWKVMKAVMEELKLKRGGEDVWLWMLTGSPAAQSPLDAYGLAKMMDPKSVPRTFSRFRDMVMFKVSQFRWIPKPNATTTIHEILQPAIRFTKDECLDLPEMVYLKREVPLSKQQEKYYLELKNHMRMAASGETVTSANAAVSINKLLQVSAGCTYTDDGEVMEFDIKPRFKVLMEVIEQTEQKVLIFANYKHVITKLVETLEAAGVKTEFIRGDVSATKRSDIIYRFQNAEDPRVLVLQPQAAAHGITLTAANTVVWWGPTASLETYTQANARVHRPGQIHRCAVIQLQGSPAERHFYSLLDNKMDIHSKILDLYKELLD